MLKEYLCSRCDALISAKDGWLLIYKGASENKQDIATEEKETHVHHKDQSEQ